MLKWSGRGNVPKSLRISRAFSDRLKTAVQDTTPVDSGRMKHSYFISTNAKKVTIDNNAKDPRTGFPYPMVVEYGSVKMTARHPIQRGIESILYRLPSDLTVEIGDLNSQRAVSAKNLKLFY